MTAQLMFMRHAKSSWAEAGLSDFDRPLNERGRRDVPRMAAWLQLHRFVPQLVLCSTALRTRETTELLCQSWTQPVEVDYRSDLYHATAGQYWSAATDALDRCRKVLVVGHNPGMQQLLVKFNRQADHFPTAAVAILTELEPTSNLGDLSPPSHFTDWKLMEFMAPKQLPAH